jgi:nucleoside-diphosphate-sugar epimerase
LSAALQCAARSLAQGHQVRAMSRSEQSGDLIRMLGAVPVRCNLEDVEAKHLTDCDVVIYAAAYVEACRVNVGGTRRILSVARGAGAKRFIHIGTEAALVHGQDPHEADESYPLALPALIRIAEPRLWRNKLFEMPTMFPVTLSLWYYARASSVGQVIRPCYPLS